MSEYQDPAPFSVLNAEGSSPFFLIADHASPFIPKAYGNLGLEETFLKLHITHDIGIAEVTRRLSAKLDATAVMSGFSRALIDANRELGDAASIPEVSDGVTIPGNSGLSAAEKQTRQTAYFAPYHQEIERMLALREAKGQPSAILSMHSFTPSLLSKPAPRPWEIGILWNEDERLSRPLLTRLAAAGLIVGDNEPYSGKDGVGYSLKVYGDQMGYAAAGIEIRQDLITDEEGWSRFAEELFQAAGAILATADDSFFEKKPLILQDL